MELLFTLIVCFFVALMIMPWINHVRLLGQKREIERLHREVNRLSKGLLAKEKSIPAKIDEPSKIVKESTVFESETVAASPLSIPDKVRPVESLVKNRETQMEAYFEKAAASKTETSVDPLDSSKPPQDWFGKLAVWVGGVALLMAGFYMVKYSIDSGLVTPVVRLWSTTLFGALLCICGFWVSVRSVLAGNLRIGQALTGAGVACFYFAVYAAVNMYGMLSSGLGFVGMIGVTGLAVFLSLRHGAPIALMGFIGGFSTPLLMGDANTNTVLLFAYLFVLFGAAQYLCVKRGWWALLFISLSIAYLWSGILLLGYAFMDSLRPEGALWFILGISGLSSLIGLTLGTKVDEPRVHLWQGWIRSLGWVGGLLQALAIVWLGEFETVDMALFSILGLGALVLAVLREEIYLWVAWLALGSILVGAFVNPEPSLFQYAVWPVCVALVFFIVGHFKALRSTQISSWRALSLSSVLMVVPIAFLNREWLFALEVPFPSFWLMFSILAGGLILLAAEHLQRIADSNRSIVGEYSAFASFLIGFGLWDYVPASYLSVVMAGLILAVAVYWRVRSLDRATLAFGVLLASWLVTMSERFWSAASYLVHSDETGSLNPSWIDLSSWYSGCVVLALVLIWFGESLEKAVQKWIGWASGLVGLLTLAATYYYLDVNRFSGQFSAQSIEGGLTALLAVLATGALFAAQRWKRAALAACKLLSGVAAFRILTVHLFGNGGLGEGFFWNALLWQFGVP
ncbi:MAG: putative membrane protein, partial [Lentimonas sp.]